MGYSPRGPKGRTRLSGFTFTKTKVAPWPSALFFPCIRKLGGKTDIWGILTSPWLGRRPSARPAAPCGPGVQACPSLAGLQCGWAVPRGWITPCRVSQHITHHTTAHVFQCAVSISSCDDVGPSMWAQQRQTKLAAPFRRRRVASATVSGHSPRGAGGLGAPSPFHSRLLSTPALSS